MRVVDDLKPHNLEAFQEINKMIESGTKKIAIPRATGSGKTYLMGAMAEKYSNDRKLVLEPSRPLLDSIKEKFKGFGIANTDFITYQKLVRMSDEDIAAMDYKVIFLDEFHHGTAPVWGMKINYLMETHSDSIIFGTSATTVRNDGVDVVESLFEGNAVGELPLSTAIARKVLPCPHYITAIYRLDDEFEKLKKRIEASTNDKAEKKEFYEKMKIMQSHFEKSYGIPTILNKYIKVNNGRYLVFCKNKKHLDTMCDAVIDWFKTAGIKNVHSYAVYSDYPDKEKDYKVFCEDNSDSCKILFSINMLNEGLHIEDVSGVLMLRTTMSDIVYCQQLGRVLEAGNLDKYLVVFDFVNNFSAAGDGAGLLKEIKDAVAREKESDPDYDDSEFEDIDTFFVLDQVVEIQEMFKEIEGRLQGSWDLYIKALKQYKEREGDCDVPYNHIEVVDGVSLRLGNWCSCVRSKKNGNASRTLTNREECHLKQFGFIWDTDKYRFKNKVSNCIRFYKEEKRLPNSNSVNKEEKDLGNFLIGQRQNIKNKNYPQWKVELLNEIPDFYRCNSMVDRFYEMAIKYKNENGHVNIKLNDVIGNYNIGITYNTIKQEFKNQKLSKEQIRKLQSIGINLLPRREILKNEIVRLSNQAVKEGYIISASNPKYKGKDLYNWYLRHKQILNEEENRIFSILIYFRNKPKIAVIDVIRNKIIGIYNSKIEVGKVLCNELKIINNIKTGTDIVRNRLTGKTRKKIYKGRFMFYYATDEEVKKYLEDGKTS